MAIFEDKYLLQSRRYAGRGTLHDTVAEAGAHYDVLMADEAYTSFDTDDVEYYIIPVTPVGP